MLCESESAFEMMRGLRNALETKIVESEDYRALAALNAAIRESERLNRGLAIAMEDRVSRLDAMEVPPGLGASDAATPDDGEDAAVVENMEPEDDVKPEDLEERISNLFALAEAAAVRPWWKRLVG